MGGYDDAGKLQYKERKKEKKGVSKIMPDKLNYSNSMEVTC